MAAKEVLSGSFLNETTYRVGVQFAAERVCNFLKLAGRGPEYAITIEDRPGNGRGETLKVRFAGYNDTEEPSQRADDVLGNESSTPNYEDSISIAYHYFSGAVKNAVADQQLTSVPLIRQEGRRLGVQWAYTFEKWMANQLASNTDVGTAAYAAKDYNLSGSNDTTAADAQARYVVGSGLGTTGTYAESAGAGTGDVLTTDVLDDLKMYATSGLYRDWVIPPCWTPFGEMHVFMTHPAGFNQLRSNSSGTLYDISRAQIEGGEGSGSNPLIAGGGFIYNDILVIKNDFMPSLATDTRRSVFFGAQAGCWVRGEGFTDGDYLGWSEHDQHRRKSILVDHVGGVKKVVVNSKDWATLAVVSHDPDAA